MSTNEHGQSNEFHINRPAAGVVLSVLAAAGLTVAVEVVGIMHPDHAPAEVEDTTPTQTIEPVGGFSGTDVTALGIALGISTALVGVNVSINHRRPKIVSLPIGGIEGSQRLSLDEHYDFEQIRNHFDGPDS